MITSLKSGWIIRYETLLEIWSHVYLFDEMCR